jgi:integrase/recombinase XerD
VNASTTAQRLCFCLQAFPKGPACARSSGVSGCPSGFERVLAKHVAAAAARCPSLRAKRVSPIVLRHTCALTTLQATRDLRKVSLWLGHASTQTADLYLQADPTEKLEALAAMTPPALRPGTFRPPDRLIATLRPSTVMRSSDAVNP